MAKKRGISGDRLRRISEELESAKQGDFGRGGYRYDTAFETSVKKVNRDRGYSEDTAPDDEPYREPERKAEEKISIPQLLNALGMDGTTFDDISVNSSRVRHIAFTPDVDVLEVLARALKANEANIALKEITGTIKVKWTNLKADWAYRGATLNDFINFKEAGDGGGSYGKYVNDVMNNFSDRGPL